MSNVEPSFCGAKFDDNPMEIIAKMTGYHHGVEAEMRMRRSPAWRKAFCTCDEVGTAFDPAQSKAASYMHIAEAYASRSKDTSTKVGAVILDAHMSARAQGWNGAPRGSSADNDIRFMLRPEKYSWSIHAEQNAIANAARAGIALEGCTMVVTHLPCMVCANMIVQVGIKLVITKRPDADFLSRWTPDVLRSRALFAECGVKVLYSA